MQVKTLKTIKGPKDIVIMGTYWGPYSKSKHHVYITDDYSNFSISAKGHEIIPHADCAGFVSIVSVKKFKKTLKTICKDSGMTTTEALERGSMDFFLVRDYNGAINLNVKLDGTLVDTDEVDLGDLIHDNREELGITEDTNKIEVIIDLTQPLPEVVKIDKKLFKTL